MNDNSLDNFLAKENSAVNIRKLKKLLKSTLNKITIDSPIKVNLLNDITEEGDVRFIIFRQDLGISFEDYIEYKTEIFSHFYLNFVGELAIRDNINMFAKVVEDIDHNEYIGYVNRFEHNGFGLKFINNQFIFSFHISLLQRLLTEDFKKQLGEIKNDNKESKEQKTKKEQ